MDWIRPVTSICKTCGESKEEAEFVRTKLAKRGYFLHCKSCERLRSKNRRRRQPESARLAQLRSKYGITKEVYEGLLQSQGLACRICRVRPEPSERLHVDHCHASGVVRGLLCQACNTGLGHFRDDPGLLGEAAEYLKRSKSLKDPQA